MSSQKVFDDWDKEALMLLFPHLVSSSVPLELKLLVEAKVF
jgi:hypothetical protein